MSAVDQKQGLEMLDCLRDILDRVTEQLKHAESKHVELLRVTVASLYAIIAAYFLSAPSADVFIGRLLLLTAIFLIITVFILSLSIWPILSTGDRPSSNHIKAQSPGARHGTLTYFGTLKDYTADRLIDALSSSLPAANPPTSLEISLAKHIIAISAITYRKHSLIRFAVVPFCAALVMVFCLAVYGILSGIGR
jgi:hypothetical protein